MNTIYYVLIQSRLEEKIAKTHLKIVDILQKKFLKLMFHIEKSFPTSDLLFGENDMYI